MTVKMTREKIAYDYLKTCGPCMITFPSNEEAKILMSATGDLFWINDVNGPNLPFITLEEVYNVATPLVLTLFSAEMTDQLTEDTIYSFETSLRQALKECINEDELSAEESRDIKIKFLDMKEEILDSEEKAKTSLSEDGTRNSNDEVNANSVVSEAKQTKQKADKKANNATDGNQSEKPTDNSEEEDLFN